MSITLSANGTSVTIDPPEIGYDCEIIMPLTFFLRGDTTYGIYDYGQGGMSFDKRVSQFSFIVNATDAGTLNGFFRNPAQGRGEIVTLALGTSATGFCPWGADLGDKGSWTFAGLDYPPQAQLPNPYGYWRAKLKAAMVSAPGYSLPSQIDQVPSGKGIALASVTALLYPPSGFELSAEYGILNILDMGNAPRAVDLGNYADTWNGRVVVNCNQSKCAALLYAMTNTVRANSFSLVCNTGDYPFGRDKPDSGTFTVQLAAPTIKVVAVDRNQYTVEMNLNFLGVA